MRTPTHDEISDRKTGFGKHTFSRTITIFHDTWKYSEIMGSEKSVFVVLEELF